MRVLIAEDEVEIAKALKVMLERSKYSVDIVHNGNDAYDYITMSTYDAIVLDIMMPGMDGLTVLEKVRSEGVSTRFCSYREGPAGRSRNRAQCRRRRLSAQALFYRRANCQSQSVDKAKRCLCPCRSQSRQYQTGLQQL